MWRDLERRANGSFFTSWDWIGTWLAEFGAHPLLMIGRRAAEIVALGLLQRRSSKLGPLSSDSLLLHQTGSQYFDCIAIEFNDFLLDKTCQDEARNACLNELLRVGRNRALPWKRLIWAASRRNLAELLTTTDFRIEVFEESPSPFVDLGKLRRERRNYPKCLSANTRYHVRRSMRLYEDWGPLQLTRAMTADEGLEWLEDLRRLHEVRWQAKNKKGAFANPFFSHFIKKIVHDLNERLDILKICAGETAIGYLCNFIYGGMAMNYQSGFLYGPDARYKPGYVSHLLAVQHYLDKRADVDGYSFLGGDAQYKLSLATSTIQLRSYIIKPGVTSYIDRAP